MHRSGTSAIHANGVHAILGKEMTKSSAEMKHVKKIISTPDLLRPAAFFVFLA